MAAEDTSKGDSAGAGAGAGVGARHTGMQGMRGGEGCGDSGAALNSAAQAGIDCLRSSSGAHTQPVHPLVQSDGPGVVRVVTPAQSDLATFAAIMPSFWDELALMAAPEDGNRVWKRPLLVRAEIGCRIPRTFHLPGCAGPCVL